MRHMQASAHSQYCGTKFWQVRLSVLETYCERVRDLLSPSHDNNLAVKQDAGGGIYVDGAVVVC
jgi:hypothetical protein